MKINRSKQLNLNFPAHKKLSFYLNYFYDRFINLWFDVKKSRLIVFIYLLGFAIGEITGVKRVKEFYKRSKLNVLNTKNGEYAIRPHTMDIICVSPAFEKQDVERVSSIISKELEKNRQVIFLDIGAHVGRYAIDIGNRFRNYDNLKIHAFEANPDTFRILVENVGLNNLKEKVVFHNVLLHSDNSSEIPFLKGRAETGNSGVLEDCSIYDSTMPGLIKLDGKTVDSILADTVNENDILVIKIDVEGHEKKVFIGAEKTFKKAGELWVLIEDFMYPDGIDYLVSNGFKFVDKLTQYNSFWVRNANKVRLSGS